MEIIKGIPASTGIAIGRIRYYAKSEYQSRQYLTSNIAHELKEFDKAVKAVYDQLSLLYEKTKTENPSLAAVNLRQRNLLQEKSFLFAMEDLIQSKKVSAVFAVATVREDVKKSFGRLSDEIAAVRVSDVTQLCCYLIDVLGGYSEKIDLGEDEQILIAGDLTLEELVSMNADKLLGIVTKDGSETCHAAIFSRTRAIPMVMGVTITREWEGQTAIVDGYTGMIYLSPDEEELKEYMLRKETDEKERESLLSLRDAKDLTADGKLVSVYANIGSLDDIESVIYYGASGIGMLRSEFQYLGRDDYPKEEELFQSYRRVAEAMGDRLVVIRTLDLGADKQAAYMNLTKEENPLMGNRGIRLCLDQRGMFKTQLRAIYRASIYGNLSVMYPMICSIEEMEMIREITAEVKAWLTVRHMPYRDIPEGVMIETPAAVMIARELAEASDFVSLGTNDLSQLTLAMDRQNPALREKYNVHHVSVMRMIRMVIDAAHEAGRKVCICGELAADADLTQELIQMGVDSLSVVPALVLPVRKAVRQAHAEAILREGL